MPLLTTQEIIELVTREFGPQPAERNYEKEVRLANAVMHTALSKTATEMLNMYADVSKLTDTLQSLHERSERAYAERNLLVRFLACIFPSGIRRTNIEGWEPQWCNCVYVDTPEGQMSWHYHDAQASLFANLPPYQGAWDGHTTQEKYARLGRLITIQEAEEEANGQTLAPVCPHCGESMRHAANVDGLYVPKTGDAVLCFSCGVVSVFDIEIQGCLRPPTDNESRRIAEHPDLVRLRDAWNKMRDENVH